MDLSLLRQTRSNRSELAYLQSSTHTFYWQKRSGINTMPTDRRLLRFLGTYAQFQRVQEGWFMRLILPYWLLALLFALAPSGG